MSWGKVEDSIWEHPKIKVTATDLDIPVVLVVAHLISLWSSARKFAEDGDLAKYDDDMIAGMANYVGDPAVFVQTLQKRRLLNGKLIHDWLDYNGEWLRTKYKTRRKAVLIAIWQKHGREYGRDPAGDDEASPDEEREPGGNLPGMDREPTGNRAGTHRERQDKALDQAQDQGLDQALSPQAQSEEETKSPNGGCGGNSSGSADADEPRGSLFFPSLGFRAQGLSPPGNDLPCGGFTVEEVFKAFESLFKFHGIHKPYDLQRRARHCDATPSHWTMVFLDKIDVSYREVDGVTRVDSENADPVGMTVSGLRPGPGKPVHTPSEAARGFFIETMQDSAIALAGGTPRSTRNVTAGVVTLELSRRKGKRKGA